MERLNWLNAVLQNDEASSDKELERYFISNGLSVGQARKAVEQRENALKDFNFELAI